MSEAVQIRRWQAPEVFGPQPGEPPSGASARPELRPDSRAGAGVAGSAPAERAEAKDASAQSMLTAERLAEIEEQARESGYRAGFEEGKRDAEVLKRSYSERLTQLLDSIAPQTVLLDDAYVEQTSHIVIAIAKQLIRRELRREPGEVVRAVREALAVLPAADTAIRIFVHPEDIGLVREVMLPDVLERPIRLLEDVALTRGGARVETDVSVVDASVEARIAAIAASVFGDERAEAVTDTGPRGGEPVASHASPHASSHADTAPSGAEPANADVALAASSADEPA